MSGWLQFSSWQYAAAGLACATGPIIIHLLNRRRFRVLHWAAIEFLLEAMRRQRRMIRLRDLLLLLLRTLAVLFFGLALARPYFASAGPNMASGTPRHLVLLIDNSLSMAYQTVDGTRLDHAKREAARLINALPDGSQISVAAICSSEGRSLNPVRRKNDALGLLNAVQLADRTARLQDAATAASQMLGTARPLSDQIVFVTDMQAVNWPVQDVEALLEPLPRMAVLDVAADGTSNSWVHQIALRDEVVDRETPTAITALIHHQGPEPRRVQVSLSVAGKVVATRTVELTSGDSQRRITWEYSFAETAVEPGRATFVPITVSLPDDRLPLDDTRSLVVPVVTSMPLLFVDQYQDEDPALGQLGETRPLRILLGQVGARRSQREKLADVRHVTIDKLSRSTMSDARLIVIAGLPGPDDKVELLRQFAEQGGAVLIAAGSDFDADQWTASAWKNGQGLLPLPIDSEPVGSLPERASADLRPFFLDVDRLLQQPQFRLVGLSDKELRDLFREPVFFKAVRTRYDRPVREQLLRAELKRLESVARRLPGDGTESNDWLSWQPPIQPDPSWPTEDEALRRALQREAELRLPTILARFGEPDVPFIVQRPIGRGVVLLVTSGLLPDWNDVAQTNAVVMWDHLIRTFIRTTLPQRNYLAQDQLTVPLPIQDRRAEVRLRRPGDSATTKERSARELLDVGFIGRSRLGALVQNAGRRGVYQLTATRREEDRMPGAGARLWSAQIAVNGEPSESDLVRVSADSARMEQLSKWIQWIGSDPSEAMAASVTSGSGMWWWFCAAVFLMMMLELAIVALPIW